MFGMALAAMGLGRRRAEKRNAKRYRETYGSDSYTPADMARLMPGAELIERKA